MSWDAALRASLVVERGEDRRDVGEVDSGTPGELGSAPYGPGTLRILRRSNRLTVLRNDSPVRARSLSISAATSSSRVSVVRMMSQF